MERLTGDTVTGEHPVFVRLGMRFKISLSRLSYALPGSSRAKSELWSLPGVHS